MASSAPLILALVRAANELDEQATISHPLGGQQIPICMTTGLRDYVATNPHLRPVLPPVSGTVAEYATQIRTLAATL